MKAISPSISAWRRRIPVLSLLLIVLVGSACRDGKPPPMPRVAFTTVPLAVPGGPDGLDMIEGTVTGAKRGQRIVLYAKTPEFWWVQPFAARPFTAISSDSHWSSLTHLGTNYAALLVSPSYVPSPRIRELPNRDSAVLAVATRAGTKFVSKIIHFGGYDWEVNQLPNNRGGKVNAYSATNAWTDTQGFLHLRITRSGDRWVCSEVALTQALGEGSYSFTVRDISQLDPAAVMTLYTWDAARRFHGEVDVEISRWGGSADENAQYVVQPYYEPANVFRFEAPPGKLTFSFDWEPGRVRFLTVRGHEESLRRTAVAEHLFTSAVPVSEGASVHMNLYAFGNAKTPMRSGSEVVIEKFEYLP